MSRVNHNAQYIYDLEGETPWEKLRVVRHQLRQRKIALELAKIGQEEFQQTQDKTTFEYRKALINQEQFQENIQDCVNEIKFLTEFEKALAIEAEKTRILGKTDDEMYEINFFDELKLRLIRSAQAQIISCGRLTEETTKRILKNKPALQLCIQQGLLSENALQIANANNSALPHNYETLHLENLKKLPPQL
jgi:hypothetical protein